MRLQTLSIAFAFLLALVAPAIAVAADAPPGAAPPALRPNIVIILADGLGFGDLGCFDQNRLTTPALDAMATEGIRFTQFYAGSPVGPASRCVLLTGRHGGRAAVRGTSITPVVIAPGTHTVASVLKAAGYATACVGQWGVGTPESLSNPNDLGFDHFYGYVNSWHAHNAWPEFLVRDGKVERLRNEVGPEWKQYQDARGPQGRTGVAARRIDYAPTLIVDDALRFVRDHRTGPFFLLLSLNTPRANDEAKQIEVPDLGEFAGTDWPDAEKRFAAAVRDLDRDAGRVLALLKELGIDKNTLVIFTSATGPSAAGGHDPAFFASTWKFRGATPGVLEGGIRVPMIARWPGTIPAGALNTRQWYAGDLLATVAELAGVRSPDDLDSDSMFAALRGQIEKDQWKRKSPLYWESYDGPTAQAVRFGKWKAIRSPMITGEVELYDMSNDFAEKRDYAKRRPDLARHAANLLAKHHHPDPNRAAPVAPAVPK